MFMSAKRDTHPIYGEAKDAPDAPGVWWFAAKIVEPLQVRMLGEYWKPVAIVVSDDPDILEMNDIEGKFAVKHGYFWLEPEEGKWYGPIPEPDAERSWQRTSG